MTLKRRAFVLGAGALSVTALGAATSSIDWGGVEQESLLVAGSEEFHPYAVKLVDGFAQTRPKLDVVVEAGGTAGGLLALKRGAIDVALTSRELTATEDEKLTRAYLVARDAIALVVHPDNPVGNLDRKQAAAILRGEVRDWGKLPGGTAGPIRLYRRKADAGTQKALDKMVLANAEMPSSAIVMESGHAMHDRLAADVQGFGFLSLHDVTPAVKVLAIDGVGMSRASILGGSYPFTRSFFCVTHGAEKDVVRAFLSFAQGPQGQNILKGAGLISVR